jgi:stearoyl-CoA desaturase (delta-9 desaturase)
MKTRRIHWLKSMPFFLVHLALIGVLFVPFSWKLVALALAGYFVRMFAITAGYHRYFSHRTYKMSRVAQFLMAFLGTTCVQKGVLWWAANHRHHHKFSDMPEDIHSPKQDGFWWSHVGWILADDYEATRWDQIPDLVKYPELVWLNKHFLVPVVVYALGMFAIGGWATFVWGFVVSTVLLWHGTFTINSLSHVFGWRRYQTTDTSRNNPLLAIITMGEGWHNNHHCYMSSTNQGFFWWEWDPSYYVLKALSWVGVTRDLRKPPLALLEAKRISRKGAPAASGRSEGDFPAGLSVG